MPGPSLQPALQQRMGMTLAPQMQQSLELLQLPVLELRAMITQEIEMNPTLEETPPEAEEVASLDEMRDEAAADDELDDFDIISQLDDEWRDYYTQTQTPVSRNDQDKHQFLLDILTHNDSLQQHLMSQLNLADLPEAETRRAELIIGSIDDDGYLSTPLEELASSTGEDAVALEDLLGFIQEFDPIGVGARNLGECLFLQLRRLGRGESLAARMVKQHLDLLAGHKYADLARLLKAPQEDIEREARLIATLDPKPGSRFAIDAPHYVLPEVSVIRNDEGEYLVLMNNEHVPRLHVSDHYRSLMQDKETDKETRQYIRDKVRSSLFLIRCISQRQQTIYNIAREIVRVQKDFLDEGITRLRPLTMSEVAGVVGVHETTVSRAISGKYMQTPQGTFEMKYFFTPGYKGADGQSVSNQTIKDAIARIVEEENPDKPLSDQAIVKKLDEAGYKVARRTIAKYREELKILPSHLRKGFKV
jgi:RNA polymerase sigma-54 factor